MPTIPESPSIGLILREERLRKRLSLADCRRLTHISVHFLDALEEERWGDLPSESHRLGFLRLYAKSLDIWSDDMLALYRRRTPLPDAQRSQDVVRVNKSRLSWPVVDWSAGPWKQGLLLGVCLMVLGWGLYHGIRHRGLEDRYVSWVRFHKKVPRQASMTPSPFEQHLTIKTDKDSWLRVLENHRLLFEGVLPASTVKEWVGPGPFRIRLADVQAVLLYWNGQPVDLQPMTRGSTADVHLPPG